MVDVTNFDQLARELKENINKYVEGSTVVNCTECGSPVKVEKPLKTVIKCEICGNEMNAIYKIG